MKALNKIIGRVCLSVVTASLVPYRIQKDKETGGFEVRSLLWAVKKTPGEERDRYVLDILPFAGKKEPAKEEAEAPAEEEAAEPVEAPVEENASEVVESAADPE